MDFELTKSIAKKLSFFKNIPLLPILIDEQIKIFTLFFRPVIFSKMIDFVKSIKNFVNIESKYHRYGGLEFRINNKEFCHIHGDGLIDILLDRKTAQTLIENKICSEHHINGGTGWISYQIRNETIVGQVVQIAKCAYKLRKNEDIDGIIEKIKHPTIRT